MQLGDALSFFAEWDPIFDLDGFRTTQADGRRRAPCDLSDDLARGTVDNSLFLLRSFDREDFAAGRVTNRCVQDGGRGRRPLVYWSLLHVWGLEGRRLMFLVGLVRRLRIIRF